MVREFSTIFIQVMEKSGKTEHLVSMSFSLPISMAVCKFVALFVVSKCEVLPL